MDKIRLRGLRFWHVEIKILMGEKSFGGRKIRIHLDERSTVKRESKGAIWAIKRWH
ncbi:hypothetical protein Hanom_Chr02g00153191 [Helianthus anomalus]